MQAGGLGDQVASNVEDVAVQVARIQRQLRHRPRPGRKVAGQTRGGELQPGVQLRRARAPGRSGGEGLGRADPRRQPQGAGGDASIRTHPQR